MASKLVTVEIIVANYLTTGLTEESPEAKAFVQYLKSEAGALVGEDVDAFDSFAVSGKGDKAKAKVAKGTHEYKGARFVNTATIVLAGVSAIRKIENSIGYCVGKLDCREVVEAWVTRWREKQAAKVAKPAKVDNEQAEPEVDDEQADKEREQADKELVNA